MTPLPSATFPSPGREDLHELKRRAKIEEHDGVPVRGGGLVKHRNFASWPARGGRASRQASRGWSRRAERGGETSSGGARVAVLDGQMDEDWIRLFCLLLKGAQREVRKSFPRSVDARNAWRKCLALSVGPRPSRGLEKRARKVEGSGAGTKTGYSIPKQVLRS